MTEFEYKEYIYEKAKKIKTKNDLIKLLDEITNNSQDYRTIVYAIAGAMIGTCKYIDESEVGGITGFQAGFIGWEMVKKFITNSKCGMKIVNYDEFLYPQYECEFKKVISKNVWENLQKEAERKLKESPNACKEVIEHWQSIVDGKIPFGYEVQL